MLLRDPQRSIFKNLIQNQLPNRLVERQNNKQTNYSVLICKDQLLKNIILYILFDFISLFSPFFQVPHRDFSSNETHSVLRYKPESDNDFGYLYCWAENVLGRMELPCAFQLIPAGKSLLKHINILKM